MEKKKSQLKFVWCPFKFLKRPITCLFFLKELEEGKQRKKCVKTKGSIHLSYECLIANKIF